jgi:hypothetical protein
MQSASTGLASEAVAAFSVLQSWPEYGFDYIGLSQSVFSGFLAHNPDSITSALDGLLRHRSLPGSLNYQITHSRDFLDLDHLNLIHHFPFSYGLAGSVLVASSFQSASVR